MGKFVAWGGPAAMVIVTILVLAEVMMVAVASANARQATPDVSPVPHCGGALPDDRMVYLTGGEGGDSTIVIAEADGTELDRFSIRGNGIVRATEYPGHALVQTFGDTDASTFYLVDVENVSVLPIDLPTGLSADLYLYSPWFAQSQSARWVLVSELFGDQVALIDVQSGAAVDLAPLVAGDEVRWGVVTSDDSYVALLADDQLRVAPVEHLDQVRAVGGGAPVANPSLSPDGRSVLYAVAGEGLRRLVREDLATGATELVAASVVPPLNGWFLDGNDFVVIQRGPLLTIKDLASDQERVLRRDADPVDFVLSVDNGAPLFVAMSGDDGGTRALIDRQSGDARRFVGVDPDQPLLASGATDGAQWLTLVNLVPEGQTGYNERGIPVGSLDARTGAFELIEDLSRSVGAVTGVWTSPRDGRFALVGVESEDTVSLWLVDNMTASAKEVAAGTEALGGFTRDGCWMVVTIAEESADGLTATTTLVPIDGGEPALTVDGYSVVWIET